MDYLARTDPHYQTRMEVYLPQVPNCMSVLSTFVETSQNNYISGYVKLIKMEVMMLNVNGFILCYIFRCCLRWSVCYLVLLLVLIFSVVISSQPTQQEVPNHCFRPHRIHRPRQCLACQKIIWNQGSTCEDCNVVCHRKCEDQVMTTCTSTGGPKEGNESMSIQQTPEVQSLPTSKGVMNTLWENLSKSPDQTGNDQLDLTYIMERIIAISFPKDGNDELYRFTLKDVTNMLKTKHGNNYLIINLSERRQDLAKINPQVVDFGWPDNLAPPLERLCSICKSIDSWLNSDPQHVVVFHCKGGRGRIAVVTAAYMNYCNICASVDQALDRFAMKRFCDDKLGGLPQPSQRRYVHYFTGLLSGAIKINSSPLYLHHILIHGVPNFDSTGGCRPFIKIYQGMNAIFTSGVYTVTDNMQKVCISISPGIPLRGDVLVKCFHKKSPDGQREIIWRCQYHTCAISQSSLVLSRQELDEAYADPRFPENGKVQFVFSQNPDDNVQVTGFQSDVKVPVHDSGEFLVRTDSYENFNTITDSSLNEINANGLPPGGSSKVKVTHVQHAEGPVDGSLYATISKRKVETSTTYQNGTSSMPNGSHNSSMDSGISSSSGYTGTIGSNLILPQTYSDNQRIQNQSVTTKTTYSSSDASPKFSLKPLDEQTQLDAILSDLLSNPSITTTSSNTIGSNAITTSKQTYTSYGTSGSYKSPENVSTQNIQVDFRSPSWTEERQTSILLSQRRDDEKLKHVPKNAFSYTSPVVDHSNSFQTMEYESVQIPASVSCSVPPSPPTRTHTLPYRADYENKDSAASLYHTLNTTSTNRMDEHASWLEQQQEKLRQKKEGTDLAIRTQQEKKLVAELKSAQSKYYTKRAQSEAEEQAIVDTYMVSPSSLTNGPITSNEGITYTIYKAESSNRDDYSTQQQPFRRHGTPDSVFDVTNSQFSYNLPSETHTGSRHVANKPPPSPGPQRTTTPTPVMPPVRTSSKEFMRTCSNGKDWPTHSRPRQRSDGVIEMEKAPLIRTTSQTPPHSPPQDLKNQQESQFSQYNMYQTSHHESVVEQSVLPPMQQGQHITTQYNTYPGPMFEQIQPFQQSSQYTTYQTAKQEFSNDQDLHYQYQSLPRTLSSASSPPHQVLVSPPSSGNLDFQKQQGHVTEVFMHRTPSVSSGQQTISPMDHVNGTDMTSLEKLERSLQAAVVSVGTDQSVSTQTTRREQDAMQQEYNVITQRMPTHTFESQQQQPLKFSQPKEPVPEPKQIREVEEERVMLRPIGAGVHNLEPEGMQTLGRPTTPAFPLSPSTSAVPPFPVLPATPYVNQALTPGFRSATSSFGTFDHQQAQVKYFQQSSSRSSDPLYTSIPDDAAPAWIKGGSQYQTQQQQEFHTTSQVQSHQVNQQQQFHSHQFSHDGSMTLPHGSSLHVDTSPRMLSSTLPRSPSSAGSPPSPGSLNTLRQQLTSAPSMANAGTLSPGPHSQTGQSSPSVYFGLSRRGSLSSLADSDAVHTTPKFVKDTSKFWYKPHITRDDAIVILKDKAPGTFVVRDSNSFPGAFGLALKVSQVPPNVQTKSGGDPAAELVRHFLIEPTPKGVRLRGCTNEPVFGSLAALVYQHSITPLALPCKLVLPEADPAGETSNHDSPKSSEVPNSAAALLAHGAACNVLYLNTVDTESLTGPQAVAKATKMTFAAEILPPTTVVHFKVSSQGITLTDNNRRLFFRRHYPVAAVTYCGGDPEDRRWNKISIPGAPAEAKIFGFVARKPGGVSDNACHLFAELDPEQPAYAIVNFVTKVMVGQSKIK